MSSTKRFGSFVITTLLLAFAPASGRADSNPPDPRLDRPSTVVVSVRNDRFQWADAGVGAAATLATTLLALGFVLVLGPDRRAEEALVANGRARADHDPSHDNRSSG
jgi:hypothetical protein